MSAYTPLQTYLADRSEAAVVMSYAEIESLLGRKLPPTAYGDHRRQWWANTETHTQALAWLRANRKTRLDTAADRVTFVLAKAPEQASTGQPDGWVAGLEPAAKRLLEDVAEEHDLSLSEAAVRLINRAAAQRRQSTLDWFAANTPFSSTSSVDLIRTDRDAR